MVDGVWLKQNSLQISSIFFCQFSPPPQILCINFYIIYEVKNELITDSRYT